MKSSKRFAPITSAYGLSKDSRSSPSVSSVARPLGLPRIVSVRGALVFLSSLALAALLPLSLPAAARKTSQAATTKTDNAKASDAKAASVQRGKKLFTSYGCYECHGRAAQGGTGPRLGPDPLPYSVFLHFVRHPPTAMPNMPPFTPKVASNQDLKDIYAFLSSLPEPPKVKDVPLLKQ